MDEGRVLALDVGDVRVGVAVSDPTGTIAQPLETYRRIGYAPDCRYVLGLCERYQTTIVVLGLPLNMDGTRGDQAEKVASFGEILSKAGLDVRYQDERLTTVTAEHVLIDGSVRRENRKQYVDKLAATVILEQWLQTERNRCSGKRTDVDNQENVVQLHDENGNDVNFSHLMTVEHNGNYYVVLEAMEDTDDCAEGEAVILRIEHDDALDEDVYVTIEDEHEFEAVREKCEKEMEEDMDETSTLDIEALDGIDDSDDTKEE